MPFLAITPLSKLLFPVDPAIWQCPIQEGLPFLLNQVQGGLLLIAALAFLFGFVMGVIGYLTAFGNEEKIKTARQTLIWTFIGALVIMISALVIRQVVNILLVQGQETELQNIKVDKTCTETAQQQAAEKAQQFNDSLKDGPIKPGVGAGNLNTTLFPSQ